MSYRLLPYAKQMRHTPTDAEAKLWRQLRAHRFVNWKFKRQQPIGHHDFVCFARRLILEVDGGQHGEQRAYDDRRTQWLNVQDFRVLRFWNHDVLADTHNVLDAIWQPSTRSRAALSLHGRGTGPAGARERARSHPSPKAGPAPPKPG